MLMFAAERLENILPEVRRLWRDHWLETEKYRDQQGYAPDIAQFLDLDRRGVFIEYTARNGAGELMGHLGYILHKSRHTGKLGAVEDYFYLVPEARRGLNAVKFLRYAIKDLTARGCCQIGMSSKLTNDIEPLLKRVGFDYVAKYFMMNVDENLRS